MLKSGEEKITIKGKHPKFFSLFFLCALHSRSIRKASLFLSEQIVRIFTLYTRTQNHQLMGYSIKMLCQIKWLRFEINYGQDITAFNYINSLMSERWNSYALILDRFIRELSANWWTKCEEKNRICPVAFYEYAQLMCLSWGRWAF